MRTQTFLLAIAMIINCAAVAAQESYFSLGKMWPSQEGPDCPIKRSTDIVGVGFPGRYATYTGADTWYPIWDADGNLYSPYTDGGVPETEGYKAGNSHSGVQQCTTGHAQIVGNDPMNLTVNNLGTFRAEPYPYGGRYPCGSLCHNGIWYHGSYCLDSWRYSWWLQRPFVGFRWSDDKGKTWTDSECTPLDNLFGEHPDPSTLGTGTRQITFNEKDYWTGETLTKTEDIVSFEKIKMGAPHFVDFGKNMEHSPDGKAYIVAHGATNPEGSHSWCLGDQIYMARVTPSPQTINDRQAWEYFAGHDSRGKARWSSNWNDIKPILDWPGHMGIVTCVYNPGLKKYLMFATASGYAADKWTYDTSVLESDAVDGPYKLVSYMEAFSTSAYFVNMPSKFISADGRTGWLIYSDNCTGLNRTAPVGGGYWMTLQEMQFFRPGDKPLPTYPGLTPFLQESNVALKARFSCSSYGEIHKNSDRLVTRGEGVIDGYVGLNPYMNWVSDQKGAGEWVRLDWDSPQRVDRVVLVAWPWRNNYIQKGTLTFSDGSSEQLTMALPDDGSQGVELKFAPKDISWVKFEITQTAGVAGLGELAVFSAN